jgi:tRNA(Ile)-lysidine synthase
MPELNQHNLLASFSLFFQTRRIQSGRFLLAVSGGIDSVVLCELSRQAKLQFEIAHCNFGLRGEESERDEQFVRSLADKYGVNIRVKKFDTAAFAEENKLSIQEAARELRYSWFELLRKEHQFDYTLLAHQANDNIETLLMNFFRGTGLNGLAGIKMFTPSGYCLRPMLSFTREAIENFAKENNLKWVEDSSNSSSKYTRNFFRNEIIPAIKKVFPEVEKNLVGNIERLNKTGSLYNILVTDLKEKICQTEKGEVRIPVKELMRWSGTSLIYEIIKDYGFGEKQVEEVIKLASAGSGKYIENEMYQLIRHRHWFIITPTFVATDTIMIEKDNSPVRTACGHFNVSMIPREKFRLDKSPGVAQLDAKAIEFPLLLRRWKEGDYFYPLGMRKKKKIARFLIDLKLPKNQKENTWVLESNKKIIWVVGLRIDDRFKITDNTREILVITNQHEVVG